MATHSIFTRQWWAVSLRSTRSGAEQRIEKVAAEIARASGGSYPAAKNPATPGVILVPNGEPKKMSGSRQGGGGEGQNAPTVSVFQKGTAASILLVQSATSYFPLAEESLESGEISFSERDTCERDFPRRVKSEGKSYLYQYPLLVAVAPLSSDTSVTVVSSPYFQLLRDLLTNWRPGKLFSMCVGIDVEEAFKELKETALDNGNLTVRSGRMVIRGIDNLRSAVFTGTNVIASSLYVQLANKEGVLVHPRDCRLRREYQNPVGGNRRPFVSWFDSNGNFRFTPGADPISTTVKFMELVAVLQSMRLVRDAETYNPLNRVGANAGADNS